MSLLTTASITTSFVLPLAQTTGLHIFLYVSLILTTWILGRICRNTKQGLGEMVHVNELYFRLMCLILSFPLVTVTVMFLLSLLLNSIMVSCEASTERDSNMQHLNYFPRAHAP